MLIRDKQKEMNSSADRCAQLLAESLREQNVFIAGCAYFSNLLCILQNSFGIGINENIKDFKKGLNLLNPDLLAPCRSFCLLMDSLRSFAALLEICLLYGTEVHSAGIHVR